MSCAPEGTRTPNLLIRSLREVIAPGQRHLARVVTDGFVLCRWASVAAGLCEAFVLILFGWCSSFALRPITPGTHRDCRHRPCGRTPRGITRTDRPADRPSADRPPPIVRRAGRPPGKAPRPRWPANAVPTVSSRPQSPKSRTTLIPSRSVRNATAPGSRPSRTSSWQKVARADRTSRVRVRACWAPGRWQGPGNAEPPPGRKPGGAEPRDVPPPVPAPSARTAGTSHGSARTHVSDCTDGWAYSCGSRSGHVIIMVRRFHQPGFGYCTPRPP